MYRPTLPLFVTAYTSIWLCASQSLTTTVGYLYGSVFRRALAWCIRRVPVQIRALEGENTTCKTQLFVTFIMSSTGLFVRFCVAVLLLSVSAKAIDQSQNRRTSVRDELLRSSRGVGVCRPGLARQKGFRALLVFVADGKFNPFSPNSIVPNCSGGVCEATYFWRDVAGLSDKVRARETAQAKTFYSEKWGIPVDQYVRDGKISFSDVYLDPRINYRCRALEGQKVHGVGWEVHDQFFLVAALQELTLGGQYGTSMTVPPNTFLLLGQYKIERSSLKKGGMVVATKKFINIRYESVNPVLPPVAGRRMASCKISKSPWGSGIALLSVSEAEPAPALTKASWRTVLTMDGGTGLGKFDGVYN